MGYTTASEEGDYSDFSSDGSTSTYGDEDAYDIRLNPIWDNYRGFFEQWGYHLDTCRDVKLFYLRYWESRNIEAAILTSPGYCRALRGEENELCKDAGLVSLNPFASPMFSQHPPARTALSRN
jgi:hypothetical protein